MALLGSLNILLGMSANAVEAGAKKANRALESVGSGAKRAASDLKSIESAFSGAGIGRLAGSLSSALSSPLALAGVGAAGITAIGTAAAATGIKAIKLAADFEQTRVAFTTMLGSAERAESVLGSLTKFAAETPFEFPELAGAARNLAAFGVRADQLVPSLRAIGDVASGISQPIGEIAQIYGKVRTQGRLYGDDIMQLGGRGIPIIAELAKQFGVAESQVSKLVEQGKVGFDNLQRAFVSLTEEGGRFHGMMDAQSQTMLGLASTLSDNVNIALREFGEVLTNELHLKEHTEDLIAFTAQLRFAAPEIARATNQYAEMAATLGNAVTFGAFSSGEESDRGAGLDRQIAEMRQRTGDTGEQQSLEIETRDDTSAVEALAKLNAKLQQQIDLYGLVGTAREIAALKGRGLTDAQVAETIALQHQRDLLDEQAEEAKALSDHYTNLEKSIDSFTSSLDKQIATFGLGSREAKLYELAVAGATEQELAAARAKAAHLDALERQKKAADEATKAQQKLADEAARLFEETRSPFEKLREEWDRLKELRRQGLIDDDLLERGKTQAIDRFHAAEKQQQDRHGDASREAKHPNAALTRGSAEAYSAVVKFINPRDQVQKKSLEELKAIRRTLFEQGKAERKKQSPAVVRRI